MRNISNLVDKNFVIFFYSTQKMSNLTCYQRNRGVTLKRAKDYYENNKKRLREQAKDKYRNLSEEEKI